MKAHLALVSTYAAMPYMIFLSDFMFLALGITEHKHLGPGFFEKQMLPSLFKKWIHLTGLDGERR